MDYVLKNKKRKEGDILLNKIIQFRDKLPFQHIGQYKVLENYK